MYNQNVSIYSILWTIAFLWYKVYSLIENSMDIYNIFTTLMVGGLGTSAAGWPDNWIV